MKEEKINRTISLRDQEFELRFKFKSLRYLAKHGIKPLSGEIDLADPEQITIFLRAGLLGVKPELTEKEVDDLADRMGVANLLMRIAEVFQHDTADPS